MSPRNPGRMLRGAACALSTSLMLFGCNNLDEPTLRIDVSVDTLPGGAIQVTNRDSRDGVRPHRWFAEERLRIGPGEARGGAGLVHPWQVLVDEASEELYVLDTTAGQVVEFDFQGTQTGRLDLSLRGAAGRLSHQVWGMRFGPDGQLVVRDGSGFSVARRDGTWMDWRPVERSPIGTPYVAGWTADGNLIEWLFEQDAGEDPSIRTWRYQPLVRSDGFATARPLPPLELEVTLVPGTPIPAPFNEEMVFTVDPDGFILFAASREYRVFRRSMDGDTVLIFDLEYDPVPVPPEARARYARAWSDIHQIEPEHVPETEPVVLRIVAGEAGRILVFPNVAGHRPGSVVDVFTAGVYEGRVVLPVELMVRHHLPAVTSRHIYGVIADDAGRPAQVVRLRVPGWD